MNIETIKNLLLLEKDEDILTELQKMKSDNEQSLRDCIAELKETNNSIFKQIIHRIAPLLNIRVELYIQDGTSLNDVKK